MKEIFGEKKKRKEKKRIIKQRQCIHEKEVGMQLDTPSYFQEVLGVWFMNPYGL